MLPGNEPTNHLLEGGAVGGRARAERFPVLLIKLVALREMIQVRTAEFARGGWAQDRRLEEWVITQHPGGYLRRCPVTGCLSVHEEVASRETTSWTCVDAIATARVRRRPGRR